MNYYNILNIPQDATLKEITGFKIYHNAFIQIKIQTTNTQKKK